jgi:hypothetical protein
VALLVCALLWAQMAGMLHRIEHMGGPTTPHPSVLFGQVGGEMDEPASKAPASEASSSSLHSCVLFDGLCMADSLPTAQLPVVMPQAVGDLPPATLFASWHALFVSHFLSRGPPAA